MDKKAVGETREKNQKNKDNTSEEESGLLFQTTDDWEQFRQFNEHCREPDFV